MPFSLTAETTILMSSGIFRLLNVEKEEQAIVSILILQSVFLGIYAGSFDVGAHSLFLKAFDASLIPRAFVISGLVGIIITSIYTILQKKLKFSTFALLNLTFVAVSTILLRVSFEFSDSKKLVFAVFVLMGPFTIISFLGFWGNVSRIFTLRQGKRLFGIIDTGQIAGIILSSYAIPVLMRLKFAILDTLLICAGSIFAALIIQLFISRNQKLSEKIQFTKKEKTEGSGFIELFKSRYTSLVALFVVFSVLTAFFVHYSFISITQENYPEPENLASFLGAFMGTLTVFTVIIKTFLYGRLMKTYGLRLALLLSPALIGIFSVIILISGSLYGFTAGASGFVFIFLLLSLSKLFAKSLKDSIEVPSSKILYQALNAEIRYDVQARIDGTVNEISAFFSGLMLAGLGLIAAINLLHYSAVLLIIVVLWFFSGIMLYNAYQFTLFEALRKSREADISRDTESDIGISKKLDVQDSKLFYYLHFIPQLWNGFLSKQLSSLINNPDNNIRNEIIRLIDRLGLSGKEAGILKQRKDGGTDEKKTADKMESLLIEALSGERNVTALKDALYNVALSENKNLHTRLIPFFRDHDPVIRASAIRAARNVHNRDIVHYLTDLLEDEILYHQAFHSILGIGKYALEPLENAFYKTGISDKGLKRVTRAIAGIDTAGKIPVLISKIDNNNMRIVKEALHGLIREGHHISGGDTPRLFSALKGMVEIAARNFTLLVSIRTELPLCELVNVIEEEYKDNMNMIFSFLSLAYDPKSVYYIRQNYETGTAEGIGYAIELLDMLIDDTIKPFLFPLFEDNSDYDKIKNLQAEYPVDIIKLPDAFYSILNSDMNQLGEYARVLTMRELLKYDKLIIKDDIIAQIFHPSKILRESALAIIDKFNPEIIPGILKRTDRNISEELQHFLQDLKENTTAGEWKKITILQKSDTFSSLERRTLPLIAEISEILDIKQKGEYSCEELFSENEIIMVSEGEISLKKNNKEELRLENDVLLLISEIFKRSPKDRFIKINRESTIIKISEDKLREFIFDNENEGMKLIKKISENQDILINSTVL